jgi:hypothetical protein
VSSWVLWGLSTEGPTQLAQGSWEQCRSQQSAFKGAGWLTGIYRAGAEPKGLLVIMEQQGMTSQRENTNRAIKATVILETLDKFVRARTPITADELERMNDQGWEALTRIAAQNAGTEWTDASPETRATVIGVLRGREATPDPFAGFPS